MAVTDNTSKYATSHFSYQSTYSNKLKQNDVLTGH